MFLFEGSKNNLITANVYADIFHITCVDVSMWDTRRSRNKILLPFYFSGVKGGSFISESSRGYKSAKLFHDCYKICKCMSKRTRSKKREREET